MLLLVIGVCAQNVGVVRASPPIMMNPKRRFVWLSDDLKNPAPSKTKDVLWELLLAPGGTFTDDEMETLMSNRP